MNVKIQNKAPFSSDNNTRSCKGYVKYLQHESEDKGSIELLNLNSDFKKDF